MTLDEAKRILLSEYPTAFAFKNNYWNDFVIVVGVREISEYSKTEDGAWSSLAHRIQKEKDKV